MTGTGRSAIRLAETRRQDDYHQVAIRRRIDDETTPVRQPRRHPSLGSLGSIGWMRRRILRHA